MPESQRRVTILGSTGSIGCQTIDVIERLNKQGHAFSIVGLSAGQNIALLSQQIDRLHPSVVCIQERSKAQTLYKRFPHLRILTGEEGLKKVCRMDGVDLVVNALTGAAGLGPTLESLQLGCTVALANKESLVIGGELVSELLTKYKGKILPIDSEHNALLQCLWAGRLAEVVRVIITASGGPFLHTPTKELVHVRPEQALRHPNWSMGKRISIDSATMVNKGFEVIEAHYLFSLPYEKIDVIIHPGSAIHSFVEYCDGSILAELAAPDMRIPIQYALVYPARVETGLPRLDLEKIGRIELEALSREQFPAFVTVLSAGQIGGTAPAAINAADEVLVDRFLKEEIPFTALAEGLEAILSRHIDRTADSKQRTDFSAILATDKWAREEARGLFL